MVELWVYLVNILDNTDITGPYTIYNHTTVYRSGHRTGAVLLPGFAING